jgi:hypothetical protein
MKKIAIFVEGLTEQLFIEKLILEMVGGKGLKIQRSRIVGKVGQRNIVNMDIVSTISDDKYYVIIYDCRGDSTVKSDILDRLPTLTKASFSVIIGLRDVYPERDIEKLRRGMAYRIPTAGLPIKIILAIMEIESWFLAEENHYMELSPKMNYEEINRVIGLDIRYDSTESIYHPAETLHNVYQLIGLQYTKKRSETEKTITAIDYANLVFEVTKRNKSLNELVSILDTALEVN